ncbi:FAD-binding protein [Polymorphobacter fuscus]|uniref:FAD-binding protein n=1 Tax=Sandarakinorhabdus fusca TaxID=1439888 RepID=A0A7C9KX15_9SPHN|nr:FAD-binding protein [Polymorphobacter fuscus]KAB7646268.1 FAD-binding protein [Polymorphobacter fuscus]MQT17485.1 FAD-binding protein [Polymorphobacter fuscus]NJC09976.1 glycolate oxidase FAD binding subunit [Polymorphobacter fuscus]
MLRPAGIDDLCAILAAGGALRLRGGGSKDGIGAETPGATVVDMRGFAGIVDYDPPELVLTVGAATPLAAVQALVAGQGQMLAFDPFDHAAILGGAPGQATIGGVIAAGIAGPARLSRGAARDHLLGFTAVSGRGERFVAGAKVVKNVTGYDLPKLVTGSWGRLVALTELTLKVLPAPRAQQTWVTTGLDPSAAVAAMARALGAPAEVTAAAHLPRWNGAPATAIRLDGFPGSIAARAAMLGPVVAGLTPLDDTAAAALWLAVRTAAPLPAERPLWRIIVPASRAPGVVAAIPNADWLFDWAGGLVWLASDSDAAQVRQAAAAAGGHAMLVRASAAMRAAVPALHPQPAPLAQLESRVRRAFDPDGVFEIGRF